MSLLLALQGAGGPTAYADSLTAGSYTISGKTVSDSVVRADNLSAGSYLLSGKNITDLLTRNDSLSAGAYSISGKTVSDSVVRSDSLSAGSYTISGKSITDIVARSDSLSAGVYAITGKDITDVVTTSGISYADYLLAGDYLITGQSLEDVVHAAQVATATPGFIGNLYKAKKQETDEEKRLRREAQGIIARAEVSQPSEQLLDDAKDVIDQIKAELVNLKAKERAFVAQNRYAEMIRTQLAQEQLQAQIEEIDTAFVFMTILAQID